MRAVLEVFLVLFSVFVQQKVTVTENITFAESVSGIQSPDCSKLAKNLENDNDATISWHDVNIQFFWHYFVSLVKFSYWSNFVSLSWPVLELWQFPFIRNRPEIWKSEIPPSEFRPISGDWGELWIPNLAWMSLIEC